MLQLILLERVEKLGRIGDTVRVRPGYARNFLLPQKKAVRATAENMRAFEARKAQIEVENAQKRADAEALAAQMTNVSVVVIRQAGESRQLYGSVSARDIADAITARGFAVTRQQVQMEAPSKSLGIYDYRVRLHPEVTVTVKVNIAQSADEAKAQAERTGSDRAHSGSAGNETPAAELNEDAADLESGVVFE
jgi:large subunit ribosomal protein L9